MAKATDQTRELEARLADLLERVTGWLQFAESKNTGLAGVGLVVGAVALMISLLLAVASFLPATDLERYVTPTRDPPQGGDNLLFYGHLARYEPETLVQAVASRYVEGLPEQVPVRKRARDLAGQIVTNARITVRKLRLYRSAVLLFTAGVLIAAAAVALAAFLG